MPINPAFSKAVSSDVLLAVSIPTGVTRAGEKGIAAGSGNAKAVKADASIATEKVEAVRYVTVTNCSLFQPCRIQ